MDLIIQSNNKNFPSIYDMQFDFTNPLDELKQYGN